MVTRKKFSKLRKGLRRGAAQWGPEVAGEKAAEKKKSGEGR